MTSSDCYASLVGSSEWEETRSDRARSSFISNQQAISIRALSRVAVLTFVEGRVVAIAFVRNTSRSSRILV